MDTTEATTYHYKAESSYLPHHRQALSSSLRHHGNPPPRKPPLYSKGNPPSRTQRNSEMNAHSFAQTGQESHRTSGRDISD